MSAYRMFDLTRRACATHRVAVTHLKELEDVLYARGWPDAEVPRLARTAWGMAGKATCSEGEIKVVEP